MANLKTEYTDVRDITHKVEHLTPSGKEATGKDRILEELFIALTRPGKSINV